MRLQTSGGGDRAELERQADMARERLVGRLDAIDRKRHELLDLRIQLRRHIDEVRLGAGALLSGALVVAALRIQASQRGRQRIREERWRALGRLWKHPERVARRRRSFWAVALGNLAVAIATFVVAEGARKLVEGRRRLPRAPLPPAEAFGV
jgi:hypothetical protein